MTFAVNNTANLVYSENRISSTIRVYDNGNGTYTQVVQDSDQDTPKIKILTKKEYQNIFHRYEKGADNKQHASPNKCYLEDFDDIENYFIQKQKSYKNNPFEAIKLNAPMYYFA